MISWPVGELPRGPARWRLVLHHGVTAIVRHPDVGSVEGESEGAEARSISADKRAIACSQLRYRINAIVHHPDVGAVEGDSFWVGTSRVSADNKAITCSQLLYGIT